MVKWLSVSAIFQYSNSSKRGAKKYQGDSREGGVRPHRIIYDSDVQPQAAQTWADWGFPGGLGVKNLPSSEGDTGSIPVLELGSPMLQGD